MKYVLDSSVAVKWAIAEIDTDKALQLREMRPRLVIADGSHEFAHD